MRPASVLTRRPSALAFSVHPLLAIWELTQANTTLGPHNRHSLREMAALVADVGAVLWSVFVVVPTGWASLDWLYASDPLCAYTPKRWRDIAA